MYKLDIPCENLTDENVLLILKDVKKELIGILARLTVERIKIDIVNNKINADLYPAIDEIIGKYKNKACIKRIASLTATCRDEEPADKYTEQMMQEIVKLLPEEEIKWFNTIYKYGTSPMLDLYMNDDTIMILKLVRWCDRLHNDVWHEMIPAFLARDVSRIRNLELDELELDYDEVSEQEGEQEGEQEDEKDDSESKVEEAETK